MIGMVLQVLYNEHTSSWSAGVRWEDGLVTIERYKSSGQDFDTRPEWVRSDQGRLTYFYK